MEHKDAEELLARALTEETAEPSGEEVQSEATKQLPPRWEIRVQAKFDPVVEETKAYRAMASEVDGRYANVKLEKQADSEKDEGQSR